MKTSKEESEKIRPTGNASIMGAVDNLMCDPLIKKKMAELGVDASFLERNLPLFLAYQEAAHACEKCRGLDECSSSTPHHTMNLFLDDSGVLNRTFGYCHYLLDKEAIRNGYLYRDFDDSFLSSDLNGFKGDTKRIREFVKFCTSAISNRNLHPWVYVYGDVGVGKSSILIAVCNRLVKSERKVAFLDCNKRFDEFKALSIKNKQLFEQTMNQIASYDILVLDDFGNEYKSDYTRDQILMPLLNYRAKKNLVTYFSSNYTLDEIKALYSTSRAGSIIASKMVSLIESKIERPYELEKGFETFLGNYK